MGRRWPVNRLSLLEHQVERKFPFIRIPSRSPAVFAGVAFRSERSERRWGGNGARRQEFGLFSNGRLFPNGSASRGPGVLLGSAAAAATWLASEESSLFSW